MTAVDDLSLRVLTPSATRAMAYNNLVESDSIGQLAQLGISARQAVDAAIGRKNASTQVTAALDREQTAIDGLTTRQRRLTDEIRDAENAGGTATRERQQVEAIEDEINTRQRAVDAVRSQIGEVEKSVAAKRREIAAVREFSDANARQEAKKAAMALSIRKTVDYFAQPPEDDGDESGAGETADETTEAGDPVGEAEAPAPDVQHE